MHNNKEVSTKVKMREAKERQKARKISAMTPEQLEKHMRRSALQRATVAAAPAWMRVVLKFKKLSPEQEAKAYAGARYEDDPRALTGQQPYKLVNGRYRWVETRSKAGKQFDWGMFWQQLPRTAVSLPRQSSC